MQLERTFILGVPIDRLDDAALRSLLRDWMTAESTAPKIIVTPNPEMIVSALRDDAFKRLLQTSDLSLPDGTGLVFAHAALHSENTLHRHIGVDVLGVLAEIAAQEKKQLALVGGDAFSLGRSIEYFTTQLRGANIIGIDPGIIDETSPLPDKQTITALGQSDVIAVGLGQGKGRGQGKQEKYMSALAKACPNARIIIGVGGAIDYLGGVAERPSMAWRKAGFEWLWRLIKEPWRARRIARATLVFPWLVTCDTLRSRRFLRACASVFKALFSHFRSL